MGTTTLQKKVFTLMMCFGMVFGMTLYNIVLHEGWTSQLFYQLAQEMWLVFSIALLLDLFLVGPLAKKFVLHVLPPETKKIVVIISIASTMVISMVLLMSIFGVTYTHGFTSKAFREYPKTVGLNFIAAYPLNLLIISPLVRYLFSLMFPQEGK